MTNYKIVFLDIDGTILPPDDKIQDSTKQAVTALREQGIEVFLATGRPLHEIAELAKELQVESFIGYNGAYGVHGAKDIFKEPMDRNLVEHVLRIAKDHGHEAVLYTHERNVFTSLDAPVLKEFAEKFHLHKNMPLTPDILPHVLGITLVNLEEGDTPLYEIDPSIYLSQVNIEGFRHSYDLIRHKVNKGFAVKTILELLNIPKENAIAFGDGMNDKEMLSNVGEGFAMGNAHPDLFAYAKHRTTTVSANGIYNGLKSLGLVK